MRLWLLSSGGLSRTYEPSGSGIFLEELYNYQFLKKGLCFVELGGVSVGEEGKAVPLHAMKAPGGRGGIAPTHS
jgi:hypothetical protein